MNDKKLKKPKIEIQTRKPQSRGIFDNLGKDRQENVVHPLSEILNFPAETETPSQDLTGQPVIKPDALSNLSTGHSVNEEPTTSKENSGHSVKENNTPSQDLTGQPASKKLDTFAPDKSEDAPSKKKILSAKTTSKTDTGQPRNANWKNWEKTRSTVRVNLHIDKELDKKVRKYCLDAEPRLELREFYEQGAMMRLGVQSNDELGANAPLNKEQLMMMWKTKPLIINLYYAYNQFFTKKVKWTAKDDLTGQKFNDVDIRVIELGILQTQANLFQEGNQNTSINGFLYYANEINRFAIYEENPEMLDAILKINRENWKKITGKSVDLGFLTENINYSNS